MPGAAPDDRAGRRADREQDREHLRPAARERAPDRVARAQVHSLGHEHHQREPDSEHGKEQVKAERCADLAAAGGEVEMAASGGGLMTTYYIT